MQDRNEISAHNVEIYLKICDEIRAGAEPMDAWKDKKADLSSRHVQRCVRQLLKNKTLWEAFNLVLDIPGLQHGMRTSTLHKLICLKCDEQVIKYLGHIRTVWSRFVQDNDEAIKKFDATDVKELELRCPRYSADDKAKIQSELDGGRIFRNFSQDERQAIWAVVTSTDCIIPSLYTFFEDVKLLQECVESMKHVISPVEKTFDRALRDSLTQGQMESAISANEKARMDLLIRELWMLAMRNFRYLSQQPRRSAERLLAKVPPQRADESKLAQFARLADQSGFHSSEISILKELPQGQEEELTDNLTATIVSDSVNATLRRCGLPTYATYEHDRWLLTAEFLHCDYSELNGRGRDVTSFFVLQSIYFAFFGRPPLIANQDSFPMHEQITRDLRQDSQSEPRSSSYTNRIELGTVIAEDEDSTNEATPERDPNINANSPEVRLGTERSDNEDDEVNRSDLTPQRERSVDRSSSRPTRSLDSPEQRPTENPRAFVVFRTFIDGKFDKDKEFFIANTQSAVEDAAKRCMQINKMRPWSTGAFALTPIDCFRAAASSRFNTIILIPQNSRVNTRTLIDAILTLPLA